MSLFTDGCCFRDKSTGTLKAAYAVVEYKQEKNTFFTKGKQMIAAESAQKAKLHRFSLWCVSLGILEND